MPRNPIPALIGDLYAIGDLKRYLLMSDGTFQSRFVYS